MNGVEKFSAFMSQHTDKVPLLSVQSIKDNRFTVLREFLSASFEDVEDNAWSVSQSLGKFIDALGTMEPEDVKKITYAYDRSRVDRALIRRKRAN